MASRTSNNIEMLIHCSQFILIQLQFPLLLFLPYLLLQKHMYQHGAHGLAGHGHGLRVPKAQAHPGPKTGGLNTILTHSGLTSANGESDRIKQSTTKALTQDDTCMLACLTLIRNCDHAFKLTALKCICLNSLLPLLPVCLTCFFSMQVMTTLLTHVWIFPPSPLSCFGLFGVDVSLMCR